MAAFLSSKGPGGFPPLASRESQVTIPAKNIVQFQRRSVLAGGSAMLLLPFKPVHAHSRRTTVATDTLQDLTTDLIAANRILAHEGVLDAFGHVSVRHPDRPDNFLMSQSRSPELVDTDDIMEFDAAGEPIHARGRVPYGERYIHAAVLAARSDVHAVVHNHSPEVLPFSVTESPLRPMTHIGGVLGGPVPTWDIADKFGDDTNLLVVNLEQGADLAGTLDEGPAVLMRGHGAVVAGPSLRRLVYVALALHREAGLLINARQMGEVKYLSPGENSRMSRLLDPDGPSAPLERAWQYWCVRAGVPYVSRL